ncbi:MAG TPA: IscS subfamily cysteine desulfurase [Legionellales bacterium]|nr:IscS subfamily cysteine desulfurase [Legionellales bacterium]
MTETIYLDYMASTPLDPRVFEAMLPYLTDFKWCANPSSVNHEMGRETLKVVETQRSLIAQTLSASPEELIFTSGATEANNIAILGAARFYKRQGNHLITMSSEHKAVLNVFEALEKEGFSVTYLKPQANGLLNLDDLVKAITPQTTLVSIMQVNNEIGVIQDIENIARLLKEKGILFHVDAAQGFGPLGINLSQVPISLMSFSAHKVYGPKGVGALYMRRRPQIQLQPILFGGGQEYALRPGTLATHQIVGMAKAFEIADSVRQQEQLYLLGLRDAFLQGIASLPVWQINGDFQARVAGNLNLHIDGVESSELINSLYPLIVSSQSACSAASGSASHVLQAIGLSEAQARQSIRISFGRMTKKDEIANICNIFCLNLTKTI